MRMNSYEETMDRKQLTPCPFCRSEDTCTDSALGKRHVLCNSCEASGPTGEDDDEAIAAWNRLAPLAPSDAAGPPTVPQAVLDALRFYARGHHYNIDEDQQQFDTVSGEPQNWLFSERDDDCTMIEDGSIAKAALCGCAQGFEEPPEPLEGEVLHAAPVAPAAVAPSDDLVLTLCVIANEYAHTQQLSDRIRKALCRAAPTVAADAGANGKRFDLRFPTVLRKMWSGSEVQAWLDGLPPLYEVPTHAQDGNNGNTSPTDGAAPGELVQSTPTAAQSDDRADQVWPDSLPHFSEATVQTTEDSIPSADAAATVELLHSTPLAAQPDERMSDAARDVLAERARQVAVESFTAEQDDRYEDGSLAAAAGCYALHSDGYRMGSAGHAPAWWPKTWDASWWKPTTQRRDLVKAGALILAEIERIDRAARKAEIERGSEGQS
jgi:Lar family restriction alleviation protein